jgi:endo-1,4-beta-mannosidase
MSEPFRLGVNYWPARTAMGWWQRFDRAEAQGDFARIAAAGFDSIRIFLTWEDFQPAPATVDKQRLGALASVMDLAAEAGLSVMPTLFTGHMSGVNWLPPWALGGDSGDARFRVISEGRAVQSRLANWYSDSAIAEAQVLLAREAAAAVAGHAALWAWDLGNENSNCVIPPDRAHGVDWLARMTGAIRQADSTAKITLGLHMEDLVEDRGLGPREAAAACDFLTMHGYPGYASWAAGPTDERLLPFLTRITRWLGGGKEVLFSEFGVPTFRRGDAESESAITKASTALVEEEEAASYVTRALGALRACGSSGAMLWCYADYAKAIWGEPPLDLAVHERSFGQWRADLTPKPAASAIASFAAQRLQRVAADSIADSSWLDLDAADFYRAPAVEIERLYRRYCA